VLAEASCIGWSVPSALAMPSIVDEVGPSACIAQHVPGLTARPFMWMVHARLGVSQPTWVPVRCKLSRMKCEQVALDFRARRLAVDGQRDLTVMIRLLR